MASPLASGKQSVSLPASASRVSRIRRDPPPAVKEVSLGERNERDARMVVIGVLTFALALVVITLSLMSYTGWSPRDYRLDV